MEEDEDEEEVRAKIAKYMKQLDNEQKVSSVRTYGICIPFKLIPYFFELTSRALIFQ